MDIFGERTLCLLSPAISSITASTFLPGSISRSRTRMGTSMERNFYTFILFSLALVILILSPSASANQRPQLGCTPMFTLLSNGEGVGSDEYGNEDDDSASTVKTHATVREEASYSLTCLLNKYHVIKWTLNGREVTPQLRDEWNIEFARGEEMDGYLFTQLKVINASQKHHAGEYKCTPQCMTSGTGVAVGANVGFTVTINIAINVTIADSKVGSDYTGSTIIYRKYVARENKVDLACKAPVPTASMTWYRNVNEKQEDMATVCGRPDVELAERYKHPPEHCSIVHDSGAEETSITLKFNRARKEGNETLKTISDFRRYVCKATTGTQSGEATAELLEKVSADRKFLRGERSVSAIEGEKLEIYCDVHGVDKLEFDRGDSSLLWTKDGDPIHVDDLKNVKKISEIGPEDRGKPVRVGFLYDMAEPEHRGQYKCQVQRKLTVDAETVNGTQQNVTFSYYVRVKDKLGALWPFLGICGEVVILCTIILIYEKRRNKTELDESDTDGSPDQ